MTANGREAAAQAVDRYTLFQITLPRIHEMDETVVPQLLLCNNAELADASEGVLYADIQVDVDISGYTSLEDGAVERDRNRRKIECLLKYPRLGQHVRSLVFRHPPPSTCQVGPRQDEATRETERLQAWTLAANLLRICPDLKSFKWRLCFGIGGDVWQGLSASRSLTTLALDYPSLQAFANVSTVAFPRISPELEYLVLDRQKDDNAPLPLTGHAGWGLGPGWESLKNLKLAGLSQNGAKTIATHLQLLCDRAPTLITLDISTHFLDSSLLSGIAQYGQLGSLKHLTLATSGTRLIADSLQQALEGCPALESFVLKDGEGRLDKNTWAQIDFWPTRLNKFEIEIDDSAGHHSWVLHHLASIHTVPFQQLHTFAIRRLVHPVAALPFPTAGMTVPAVQKGHELEAVPANLLDAIIEGETAGETKLHALCLDWWELGPNELDNLVKACSSLRKLQVAISFPLVKLITMMQPTFAATADLEELVVTSAPRYNLDFAASKSKADYTVPGLPAFLMGKLQDPDPSIPETKDLRKFVRRMPKLKSLRWTGRGGKGEWTFAKKTTLVSVSFTHSAVFSRRDWEICQLDPPFFEYDEPSTTKPTLLELPPTTPTVASSPITEFPSLSRTSTTASATSARGVPLTPGSPTHSKSLAIREVNSRLAGLGIEEEQETGDAVTPHKARHRRETTDGSLGSALDIRPGGGSGVGVGADSSTGKSRGRQTSLNLSKTTKRLSIGGGDSLPPVTAPITLKSTSAPTRGSAPSVSETRSPPASATSNKKSSEKGSAGGSSSNQANAKSGAGKSGRSSGPRHSK